LLEDAGSRWREPLAALGRSLGIWSDDPELRVRASSSVLREILDVLLDNAVRHGAGGVVLLVRRTGGLVGLDVADEGAGEALDPEELFAGRSGAGGHGIGLASRAPSLMPRAASSCSAGPSRLRSRCSCRTRTATIAERACVYLCLLGEPERSL